MVTPPPSSTPLERYSQTHIPIEVRERIRALVREVVEESMAPLLRWQKDVDLRLERDRVRAAAAGSSANANHPQFAKEPALGDPWSPIASGSQGRPAGGDYLPTGTPGARIDVPTELDGVRRKRFVIWFVTSLIIIVLTGFLSAMAGSQWR